MKKSRARVGPPSTGCLKGDGGRGEGAGYLIQGAVIILFSWLFRRRRWLCVEKQKAKLGEESNKTDKRKEKEENENVQFISPVFHGLFRISGSKKGRERRGVDQLANDVRKEEAKLIKYLNYLKVFYYYFLPVLEAALF